MRRFTFESDWPILHAAAHFDLTFGVNVISPGTAITPGCTKALGLSDGWSAQIEAQSAAATPLGRADRPDGVAKAVVFLAAHDSSDIAGVELFVGGGMVQI